MVVSDLHKSSTSMLVYLFYSCNPAETEAFIVCLPVIDTVCLVANHGVIFISEAQEMIGEDEPLNP
jgi:hypothetical protein